MQNIILIIGNCGVGKTWVMKQLISKLEINPNIYTYKTGLYQYLKKDDIIILGKYDGTVFEGSDRLSMSIMSSNAQLIDIFSKSKFVIAEGDRFTNNTFINTFKPLILKIDGSGESGRIMRSSTQTERHLKSINTRVNNIKHDVLFNNSKECINYILNNILNK